MDKLTANKLYLHGFYETSMKKISFKNTRIAFADKNDRELRRAYWIFRLLNYYWFVKIGTRIAVAASKLKLPLRPFIKPTIFAQFCGGESLKSTVVVTKRLAKYNISTILDYAVEGKEAEADFEHTAQKLTEIIKYVSANPEIPYISIKITSLADIGLLEKMNEKEQLTEEEHQVFALAQDRLNRICRTAYDNDVGLFIDAEESWIQDPIDELATSMMHQYNRQKPVIFNTIQLYRRDRLRFLKKSFEDAEQQDYFLGVKLVRGAYMEKERARAEEKGYSSPIQKDKKSTDDDFNAALEFCIEHISRAATCAATHNEKSNKHLVKLIDKKKLNKKHPHILFAQLYGMSDHISFNLAKEGYNVAKYLPFGPVREVIPYLIRRAQENTSISGQMSRELTLIQKEIKRRKLD